MSDPLHVADDPMRYIAARFRRFYFRIGKPGGLVLPAGRKLQRKMALADRIGLLEAPNGLQPEGLLLYFIFVADDVANVGGGNAKDSVLHIGDQFAALDGSGDIECFLVLNLIEIGRAHV